MDEKATPNIVYQYPDGHLVESDSCAICAENILREKNASLRTALDAKGREVEKYRKALEEIAKSRKPLETPLVYRVLEDVQCIAKEALSVKPGAGQP
jgi:hypothetical protein